MIFKMIFSDNNNNTIVNNKELTKMRWEIFMKIKEDIKGNLIN